MIRVVDLLGLPSLENAYVIAGFDGIDNIIKKIDLMETPFPEVEKFLVPHECMFTTLYSLKDDKENRINLLKAMIEHKCACIAIIPGPYLGNVVDQELIDLGNNYSFPIIYLPADVRYSDIFSEYTTLSHTGLLPKMDSTMLDVLYAFSEFHRDNDLRMFCKKLRQFLSLPIVIRADSTYYNGLDSATSSAILSKAHAALINNPDRNFNTISLRINEHSIAIVYYGKKSILATKVSDTTMNNPALRVFHNIAPVVVKELDLVCKNDPYPREPLKKPVLEENALYYIGFIRSNDINSVAEKIGTEYLIYEKNLFYNYVLFLIPYSYDKKHNIFLEHAQIMEKMKPELYIFSQTYYPRKELVNEIEMLNHTINSLFFLKGAFSTDELPLIYALNYAPHEYKEILRGLNKTGKRTDDDRSFLDTLRLYLVLRNINDVSNILNIHVNSVKYRINKCLKDLGYENINLLGDLPALKLLLLLELLKLEDF